MNTKTLLGAAEGVHLPSGKHSAIHVTKPSARFNEGSHGFERGWGVSARVNGADALSMAYGKLPGHVVAEAHSHSVETAIFILTGRVRVFFGDDLREYVDVEAQDFLLIPAGVQHVPVTFWPESMEFIVVRATPVED